MSRSRYRIVEPQAPHFMTFTVLEWLPVFTRPDTVEILLEAFTYRRQNWGVRLYGYVILENHLHCILQSPDLEKQVKHWKSYTARQIIDYLRARNSTQLLAKLAYYKKGYKTDRDYQLWEEGSHPQWIQNEAMLVEKLASIHNNPVKRGYVDRPEHWRYSSARNYLGMEGLIPVYTEWWTRA
ncbi:REP-associated tyrosine transposase [Candidatus Thiosymbion oneisti]|uniref:REP-associated tyrosine transposase n=2 Tax=Candidatus Thiosymbion oneisti TaxID=589554 RepID=UPI000A7F1A8B|nr:transposase [Candidatus Thiosymbion oneisti]